MNSQLTEAWERPVQILQTDLFERARDEALSDGRVSEDEVEAWRSLGWISFDIRDCTGLDDGQLAEIMFVRDLARSGLSRIQIDEFLSELAKPYRYDPQRVAYSFASGWVQLPRIPSIGDRDDYIRDNVADWIMSRELLGDLDTLESLAFMIVGSTARIRRDRP